MRSPWLSKRRRLGPRVQNLLPRAFRIQVTLLSAQVQHRPFVLQGARIRRQFGYSFSIKKPKNSVCTFVFAQPRVTKWQLRSNVKSRLSLGSANVTCQSAAGFQYKATARCRASEVQSTASPVTPEVQSTASPCDSRGPEHSVPV